MQESKQAYAYGGDNPVDQTDPSGRMVIGVCGGVAVALGGSFEGSICLVRTVDEPWDDIGFAKTVGFGWGSPNASAHVGLLFSNADRIGDLGGWFNDAAAGWLGSGVSVFWGYSPLTGHRIWGIVLERGVGPVPFPTIQYGYTYTWTSVERNGWIANPLRWAFDGAVALLGGYSRAGSLLELAKSVARF